MAIKVDAGARMDGMQHMDGRTEEVYLPGVAPGDAAEGPYDFDYPRMGRIIAMQRTVTRLSDVEAMAESAEATFDWLAKGFGRDAWEHIEERLADRDDVLDDEHLHFLFRELLKTRTGRPTTSSNGASRQPWKSNSTAAQSQQVFASEN